MLTPPPLRSPCNARSLLLLQSPTRKSRPARSTRILVLSDPQVVNFNAPTFVRRPVRSRITQFILDTFLRKSWMVAKRFQPDAVFITGDMMHSGRQVASEGECVMYCLLLRTQGAGYAARAIVLIPCRTALL
jgi:hypothetical protein